MFKFTPKGSKETTMLIGEEEELAKKLSEYMSNLFRDKNIAMDADDGIALQL